MYGLAMKMTIPTRTTSKNIDKIKKCLPKDFIRMTLPDSSWEHPTLSRENTTEYSEER